MHKKRVEILIYASLRCFYKATIQYCRYRCFIYDLSLYQVKKIQPQKLFISVNVMSLKPHKNTQDQLLPLAIVFIIKDSGIKLTNSSN